MKKAHVWIYVAVIILLCFYARHRLVRLRANQQLFESIEAENKSGILQALQAGADVHAKDPNGNSMVLRIWVLSESWHSVLLPPRPNESFSEWAEIARSVLDADKAPEKYPSDMQQEFIMAVMTGRKDIVERLIDHGASLNDSDVFNYNTAHNALSAAVSRGQTEIAELLLNRGAKPEQTPQLLHDALIKCDPGFFQRLLRSGIDVNLTDTSGTSVLSMLAGDSNLGPRKMDYLNLLLAAGAEINRRVTVTIEKRDGASITYTKARSSFTPLHSASYIGDLEFVQALMSHGAKIEPDIDYLHGAAMSGNKNLIQFLLDRGANPLAKDWSGDTALNAYRKQRNNKPDIVAMLEAAERKSKQTAK